MVLDFFFETDFVFKGECRGDDGGQGMVME